MLLEADGAFVRLLLLSGKEGRMREDLFVRYLAVALLVASGVAMLPIAALAGGAGA